MRPSNPLAHPLYWPDPARASTLLPTLALSLLLTACDSGNTLRPIAQAGSGKPASAPASAPTAFAHPADETLRFHMQCEEAVTAASGSYEVENNVWGKGALTDWSQCVGATNSTRRGLAARWTWDWKS